MAKRTIEKKRDDGSLIYKISKQRKIGRYYLNPDSSQTVFVKEIELKGFDSFPSGLYRGGAGMTASGYTLLSKLHSIFGRGLRVCISATDESGYRKVRGGTKVTLNHEDLKRINAVVRDIKHERRQEIGEQVSRFLGQVFPDKFDAEEQDFSAYTPGTLARALETGDVIDNLSDKDRAALQAFLPGYVQNMEFSLRSTKNVRFVAESFDATRTVYLKEIIAEYKKKMKGHGTEHTWQRFLHKHILLLLHSYSAVIEKQSVAINGKYPDFMLIDPYGYLDIYEIKKPSTSILKFDRGRKNYYWNTEVCKAISQVENYIDEINRHSFELCQKIQQKVGVSVKIVRPRGYIIAGTRAQLKDDAMAEDLRVLNDSLKNIDIIFYDDLLENLESMLRRLSGEGEP